MNLADHLMQDQNIVSILQVHLYKEYVGQYLKKIAREKVNKTIKINTKEEKKKMFEQQIKWMIRPHTHTHTHTFVIIIIIISCVS